LKDFGICQRNDWQIPSKLDAFGSISVLRLLIFLPFGQSASAQVAQGPGTILVRLHVPQQMLSGGQEDIAADAFMIQDMPHRIILAWALLYHLIKQCPLGFPKDRQNDVPRIP